MVTGNNPGKDASAGPTPSVYLVVAIETQHSLLRLRLHYQQTFPSPGIHHSLLGYSPSLFGWDHPWVSWPGFLVPTGV